MTRIGTWIRDWYVSLRYGSRLTRSGRELRGALDDPLTDEFYAEVDPDAWGAAGYLLRPPGVIQNPGGMIMGVDHDFAPGGPKDNPIGEPR